MMVAQNLTWERAQELFVSLKATFDAWRVVIKTRRVQFARDAIHSIAPAHKNVA